MKRIDWHYVLQSLRPHWRPLIWAQIAALAIAAGAVLIPLLVPALVDELLMGRPGWLTASVDALWSGAAPGPLVYLASVVLLVVVARALLVGLEIVQSRALMGIAKDVTLSLRQAVLEALRGVAMAEYETRGSGRLASRFITDVEVIDRFFGEAIARFVVAALSLLGMFAALFWLSWPVALMVMLLNPFLLLFTLLLGRRIRTLKRRENQAFEGLQDVFIETLDAMQQLRTANREDHYLSRIGHSARALRDQSYAHAWMGEAAAAGSRHILALGIDIFRVGAVLMVLVSDLSIGQMTAVFSYLWLMVIHIRDALRLPFAWFGASAALQRIDALTDLARETLPHDGNADPFDGVATVGVQLKDVCFAYADGPTTIDRLSLDIAAGERVALVGTSGGGKSTLVQLLLGLYSPQSGDILFNGIALADIGSECLRANIAAVPQHPMLLNATVRDNLDLGRGFDDERLWQALAVAQLDSTIRELPAGLDGIIGRQGLRLSGGQRQRLAIARMVLAEPKLVILDEATSALDSDTEARVHAALSDWLCGRTTLIIAHRHSAVRQADRVLVFDEGRIVEHGSHDELVRRDGIYRQLYGDAQS